MEDNSGQKLRLPVRIGLLFPENSKPGSSCAFDGNLDSDPRGTLFPENSVPLGDNGGRCSRFAILYADTIRRQLIQKTELMQENKIQKTELMRDRLLTLMQYLGLNQREFCESIGISQSRLSEVMNRRAQSFSADVIVKIIVTHNVNANWFLTGEGEMFNPLTTLTGKTTTERIKAIGEMRRTRQIIPFDIAEAAKKRPELLELIKLLSKIPADKYQQIKQILKSFQL